jgi:hypothetical protein
MIKHMYSSRRGFLWIAKNNFQVPCIFLIFFHTSLGILLSDHTCAFLLLPLSKQNFLSYSLYLKIMPDITGFHFFGFYSSNYFAAQGFQTCARPATWATRSLYVYIYINSLNWLLQNTLHITQHLDSNNRVHFYFLNVNIYSINLLKSSNFFKSVTTPDYLSSWYLRTFENFVKGQTL